jgi:hypothetical protein
MCVAAFNSGYGSTSDVIEQQLGFTPGLTFLFSYAIMSVPTTDLAGNISSAQSFYRSNIQCCMPLGSNDYIELLSPASIPVIITSGAGDTQNRTAYGNGLEFWDVADTSSESCCVVAGKIYKIQRSLNCSWWEARYRARMTASNNGVWDKFNGYGKINVNSAISYAGEIIPDPYD